MSGRGLVTRLLPARRGVAGRMCGPRGWRRRVRDLGSIVTEHQYGVTFFLMLFLPQPPPDQPTKSPNTPPIPSRPHHPHIATPLTRTMEHHPSIAPNQPWHTNAPTRVTQPNQQYNEPKRVSCHHTPTQALRDGMPRPVTSRGHEPPIRPPPVQRLGTIITRHDPKPRTPRDKPCDA